MKGLVFSVEEFALFDGPGIRTAVFMKGCSMRCRWCHNPEGLSPHRQLVKNPNGCIKCGRCAPFFSCDELPPDAVSVCPKKLLRISGEEFEAKDLAVMLLKNERILCMNGGGITFSGGECLLQADFLLETIACLGGRLDIAIETGGYADNADFLRVLDKTDFVYFDLKVMDDELARKFTGRDTSLIMRNFRSLCESGKPFAVRVPLIPTVTDTPKNYAAIVERVKNSGARFVELLPYNKLAGGKYASVGKKYDPGFDVSIDPVINTRIFAENGIDVKVY